MRALLILALGAGCGGGQSIGPGACEHTQPDPVCCTEDTQCSGDFTESCLPPGFSAGCGICNSEPSTCIADGDCKPMGATMICQPRTCACEGESDCVPGCVADTDCSDAAVCNLATNRCTAKTCELATDCPVDFDCPTDHCVRASCESNNDCDAFCVQGSCFQSAGECVPTPI